MGAPIHITAWERKSTARRILLASARVGLLIAILTALIDLLGPPISIFATTRWMGRRAPEIRVAPQPLTDYSVSSGPAELMSYFGYEFEVPWNAAFKAKGGKASIVALQFDSGQSLIFNATANQSGLFTEIVQDRSMNMANLQIILGDLTNRSAYNQEAVLLSTTPESVRAFGPRAEAVRGATLLTIKAIAAGPGLTTGAFSFQFPDKRGFQVGDPQKSKRVDLEVFDMGGHHVEILLFSAKDGARLSQSEINRILTSLRPAKADAPVSN